MSAQKTNSPHANTSNSTANKRSWTAPGGIRVSAERTGKLWTINEGPAHIVGREYKTIKVAREAVKQSPDPSVTLTTADVAARLGVTAQRVRAIAQAREIEPARVVGRAFLWSAADMPRFALQPSGRPRKD